MQSSDIEILKELSGDEDWIKRRLENKDQAKTLAQVVSLCREKGLDWWGAEDPRATKEFSTGRRTKSGASALFGKVYTKSGSLLWKFNEKRTGQAETPLGINSELLNTLETTDAFANFLHQTELHPDGEGPFWPADYRHQGSQTRMNQAQQQNSPQKQDMQPEPPLNQILYGPPGTGKTYSTIQHALEILDPALLQQHPPEMEGSWPLLKGRFDTLRSQNRIEFVTFHQSMSYEDFVEGLRAVSDEESGSISYEVSDGIFKQLCTASESKVIKSEGATINIEGRKIWKMSLGNTLGSDSGIYDECIDGGYVLLGYGEDIDFSGSQSASDVRERYKKAGAEPDSTYAVTSVATFILKMKPGDLVLVSDGNFKFRAIGEITGEYEFQPHQEYDTAYAQKRKVRWLKEFSPSLPHTEVMNKRFSQTTLYKLSDRAIDRSKLDLLLNEGTKGEQQAFFPGQTLGSRDSYIVKHASKDLLSLQNPNGNTVDFSMNLIHTLGDLVRQGTLTIKDIADKHVFEKAPTMGLEPYIVNGYNNILPQVVDALVKPAATAVPDSLNTDRRVLIIDEINRGSVSRIFGELITLIEPSKRKGGDEALSVTLPYSRESLAVPSGLYIIGTMNTADRSLSGVDLALRRRFFFKEMPPRPELLDDCNVEGINISKLLSTINSRIEMLLDRDHCLGHAYFMPLRKDPSLVKLGDIFENQVIPLLQEYFFEDWQRVQWVLNDHRKPLELQFIVQRELNANELFGDVPLPANTGTWQINIDAFRRANAYQGIIQAQKAEPA